jgi:type II secretory pathway predicted ATPase ExeA
MALYLEHFGLSEPPFRITPHTDFFFDGAERGTTLEALTYAVLHDEGIVKVSGEVGSGKTMLCRMLMERLPKQVETIYLATPSLAREEILHAIADDLDLRLPERRTLALRELQEHLIRLYGEGRRVVILIDEAHVMPEDTLEQVRLLSNLESNRHKLLQIVLFGQPELDATLAKPSLRQLRDRITHGFRMRPLAGAEVSKYLSFRMRAAGYRGPEIFSARAAARIARASAGLTRRINILADKALLAAYTENTHAITERHAKAAIADSEFTASPSPWARRAAYFAAALLAGALVGAATVWRFASPAGPSRAAFAGAPAAAPRPPATRAAEEDSGPADEDLAEIAATEQPAESPSEAAPSLLSSTQARRLEGYSAPGQPLLSERLAATRQLLEHAAGQQYAIELFVTDNTDPARMERFLARAREMVPLSDLYVVPMAAGPGRYRLRVVYGVFQSAEDAHAAQRRLPPKYQREFQATARRIEDLRRQL